MRRFLVIFISILLATGIISCKKSGNKSGPKQEVDVYVTGSAVSNGQSNAAYWKNGKIIFLNSGLAKFGYTNGIAANSNNLCLSGSVEANNQVAACYWRNGVFFNLEGNDKRSEAIDIAIKGDDIYVVGHIVDPAVGYQVATCWKNGIKTNLIPAYTNYSYVSGIAISGNDIYISGGAFINGNDKAVVWKNGITTELPFLSKGNFFKQNITTSGITVFDNDVIVAGYEYAATLNKADANYHTALYWKNNVVVPISKAARTNSISVSNNGISVAGCKIRDNGEPYAAVIWKNGVMEVLNESTNAVAVDVAVNQEDTYATGVCAACKTAFWKNGISQKLDTDPIAAKRILVIPR